jgi:Tfp pilus assembly protein PilV
VASEQGSLLIEVLVAAVLVAVMAAALFGAMDSSARVSALSKARAGAASLAQDDQERLRSMAVAQLSNLRQTQPPIVVDNITYRVDSRADWIRDATSSTDCSASAAADYLKITSTVTATGMPQLKPVTVVSQVTPAPGTFNANQGSLAVQVRDLDGHAVPGATVSITGTASDSDVTDDNGCVFFGYKPVGGYTVQATKGGYVDPDGNAQPRVGANITSQQVSTKPMTLGQAGSAVVNFKTKAMNSDGTTTLQDSFQTALSLRNTNVQGSNSTNDPTDKAGYRLFTASPATKSITASNLYPFSNPYSAYAGDCTGNDPAGSVSPLTVSPGANPTQDVVVPSLNVQSLRAGVATNARVEIKSVTPSPCVSKTWFVNTVTTRGATGLLADPGLPYGSYQVCADFTVSGTTRHSSTVTTNLTAAVPVSGWIQPNVPTSGSSGACNL